jgi:hypothetical protein
MFPKSFIVSKWKYRTLQIVLIVPAGIILFCSLFLKGPAAPVPKDRRVVELESSLNLLGKEVVRLQSSVGDTQAGLSEIFKKNLSIRGMPGEVLCQAIDPKAPDFCLSGSGDDILAKYQSILKAQKERKELAAKAQQEQLQKQQTLKAQKATKRYKASGTKASKSTPVVPKSVVLKPTETTPNYKLKDSDIVVDADKLAQFEFYLNSTTRVLKVLSTEMQTIKSALSSLADEVTKSRKTNSPDYLSWSANIASVLSLLLAFGLAIQKRKSDDTQSVVTS